MSKIKPYSDEWEKLANQMAREVAPEIYACADCGLPVFDGWCCTHCGSNDPRNGTKNDEKSEQDS